MRRSLWLLVVLMVVSTAWGQEPDKKATEATASREESHFYRLEYSIRELDGAKVLSKRSYVTSVRSDGKVKEMRTGTRVPVVTGTGSGASTAFQYMDVGLNIDSRAQEHADTLSVDVTYDLTSIAPTEASANGVTNLGGAPLLRQLRGSAAVTVTPGKPTLVFAADEPTSSHRFELELVVTRMK